MKQYEYRVKQIQIELKGVFKSNKNSYNKEIAEKLNILGKEGMGISRCRWNMVLF